jgi:methanogenic corrinoid protein MtbC1
LRTAQERNRSESITGRLVYDEGRFFQWLEGPAEGLRRVWQSIRSDRRHTSIALLGESPTPVRAFGDFDMHLATRRAVADPQALELARLLIAAEPTAAFALIDGIVSDGRSIAALCAGLFEPAARALGDLWQADDCSEIDVTLALGHLQVALHRASLTTPPAALPRALRQTVLLAPASHELHLLGSAMSSELFWRAGWDVLATIRAARAGSRNPALAVIVGGRVFGERPLAFAEVGADASSAGASNVVAAAQQLMAKAARR